MQKIEVNYKNNNSKFSSLMLIACIKKLQSGRIASLGRKKPSTDLSAFRRNASLGSTEGCIPTGCRMLWGTCFLPRDASLTGCKRYDFSQLQVLGLTLSYGSHDVTPRGNMR